MFDKILKKEEEIVVNPNQTTTLQAYHTKVIGDIVGHDGVYIDGVVDGCVIVDNIVFVGKDAEVKGKIQAQHVVVEGEVRGAIECDFLDIKSEGLVLANIEAREIKIAGKLQGETVAYDLSLAKSAFLGTKVQVNRMVLEGTVIGDIASDSLILKDSAYVKGNIFVNSFINEGAVVKGEIGDYKKLLEKRTPLSSNQTQNIKILKESIEKYIKNSNYINEILRQKVDIDVKVNNLINYIKDNVHNNDELVKVTRLINYNG
jgi:cytoskeletal protein CcmA (bactofilin family)